MENIIQKLCYLITKDIKNISIKNNELLITPLNSYNDLYISLKSSFSEFLSFCSTPPLFDNEYNTYIEKLLLELKNKDINELISLFYMENDNQINENKDIIDVIIENNEYVIESGGIHTLAYEVAEYIKEEDYEMAIRMIKEGIEIAKIQNNVNGMKIGFEILEKENNI